MTLRSRTAPGKTKKPQPYPRLPSTHFDSRPPGTVVDTLVIHSMYDTARGTRSTAKHCKVIFDRERVSSHYLIDRDGTTWNCVPEEKRAWHAGVSTFPEPYEFRENINHASIGVELIGTERSGFTPKQYQALAELVRDLSTRHPITFIFRHSEIAPERKSDPWKFDAEVFEKALQRVQQSLTKYATPLAREVAPPTPKKRVTKTARPTATRTRTAAKKREGRTARV